MKGSELNIAYKMPQQMKIELHKGNMCHILLQEKDIYNMQGSASKMFHVAIFFIDVCK